MHHCIADGIALARVMMSLTDEAPDAGIAPPGAAARHAAGAALDGAGRARGAARGGCGAPRGRRDRSLHPRADLAGAGRGRAGDARTLAKLLLTAPTSRPRSGASSASPAASRGGAIPLDAVKAVGHATARPSTTSLMPP